MRKKLRICTCALATTMLLLSGCGTTEKTDMSKVFDAGRYVGRNETIIEFYYRYGEISEEDKQIFDEAKEKYEEDKTIENMGELCEAVEEVMEKINAQ